MPSIPSRPPSNTVEVIDPRWLLKALAVILAAALVCGYITLCVLFWQGQWQLVLHPSRFVAQTPAQDSLPFQSIEIIGVDSEVPALAGWYVPSDSTAYPTVLLMHGGDGSMADTVPFIQLLHTARLNVLTFDYGGYGTSAGPHPSQQRMQADADRVFDYLTHQRSVPANRVILAGQGLGASLAVRLCKQHSDVAALLLDQPDGDVGARIAHDPRARLVPTSLLFQQTFPLADALTQLRVPKLIVTHSGAPFFTAAHAADPKITVELPADQTAAYFNSLRRFLDQYVTQPAPSLMPGGR